jgi:hypothetical protein
VAVAVAGWVVLAAAMSVAPAGAAAQTAVTLEEEGAGALFVWSGSLGLGAALRVASRAERLPPARSEAYTGLGQVYGRLAAYDHTSVRAGLVKFIAVDVSQTLDLGATVVREASSSRSGLSLGTSGTTAMQLGWAGERRVTWYVKSLLEQRFAVHLRGRVEGGHYDGGAGVGGGLRLHWPGRRVLQVGPIVAGSGGVHDLGRLVNFGNVIVGADLGLFARPARGVQFAWTLRAQHGFFDRRAGVRDRWRTTLDLALARAGSGKIRSVNVVVIYEGDRIAGDAAPDHGWLSAGQETRVVHALLIGVGIGFGQGE